MAIHTLYRKQFLPISLQTAWDFFSTPINLAKITPKEMDFVILTQLGGEQIYEGMLIEYRVKPLFGIPVKWVTRIGKVVPNLSFVDNQLKGPYSLWEHTHTFEEVPGGVNMTDEVRYELPMGPLGEIAHALIVKNKLKDIFDFRAEVVLEYFSQQKK